MEVKFLTQKLLPRLAPFPRVMKFALPISPPLNFRVFKQQRRTKLGDETKNVKNFEGVGTKVGKG